MPVSESDTILTQINKTSKRLTTHGLTRADQEILKNPPREGRCGRLELIWSEERESRARQLYNEIQNADEHLFLAFVLTISPT